MGTVGNMQSLKPLVLLILGVCFVKGCGSKKTQTVGGYPQNGAINTQNAGGYPQNAGGYPQNTGGYPSNSGGYPQTGGNSQSNENISSVNSIPNPSKEKIQDISGMTI